MYKDHSPLRNVFSVGSIIKLDVTNLFVRFLATFVIEW